MEMLTVQTERNTLTEAYDDAAAVPVEEIEVEPEPGIFDALRHTIVPARRT